MSEDTASLSTSDLIRAGFTSVSRAGRDVERLRLTLDALEKTGNAASWSLDDFLRVCSRVDDPDGAVWHVADVAEKLAEKFAEKGLDAAGSAASSTDPARAFFSASIDELSRIVALCGVSDFLGRILSARPELLFDVLDGALPQFDYDIDFSGSYAQQVQYVRTVYWRNLLHIATDDAVSETPLEIQPVISKRLSALIDATLRAALRVAYAKVPASGGCRFAVFAMGKLGAQEINYISDVDLVYIVDKSPEFQGDLTALGTQIGSVLHTVCSGIVPGVDVPALWDIDTALRPEGKAGALVRTVESAQAYYENWAENWEFQALLKARFVAGDADVARAFSQMIEPLIWSASARPNFVYDCRAMRTRVEQLIPLDQKDREIKLGKGGLRDVEFTVQMLQLVHGRTDESLRIRGTLDALKLLAHGGYINRQQARALSEDYRFLRVLEHRQQLKSMKRTHLFPKISSVQEDIFTRSRHVSERDIAQNADIVRLSRAVSLTPVQLVERFDSVRREIRHLHMDIYYRPMLPNISQLSDDDITLSEDAMRERFESVGFADPEAAMRHVESLTSGISRSSRINRILLPTVLLWIGSGQNPDMGLMMWRRWVDTFGGSGPYLGFLRDSPTALRRMCHILSNSRYLSDALMKSSESTFWLGDDVALQPRSTASLRTRTNVMLTRFSSLDTQNEFATLLRALRRREIERVGLGWMSSVISSEDALHAMTRVYDVLIDAAVRWAAAVSGPSAPARLSVIAMGRYGGEEVNFSSDADLMFVYEACEGHDEEEARTFALRQVDLIRAVLMGVAGTEQKLELDMDLRPEGKNGPLVRSFESYRDYYARWSETWERQALLRARYAAGDEELGTRFIHDIVDPLRYSENAVSDAEIQSIRKLKARMEAERLPRGVRSDRHIKLGRGGLSDVEWTIQLLQLKHAHEWSDIRTTHTLDALTALEHHGAMSAKDAAALRDAWALCTNLRNASFLWSGRVRQADIIPDDFFDMGGLGVVLGHPAHRGAQYLDDVMGIMRKCRDVVDRLFYGQEE
ncbi:bifunctional [glutamine synthetase] adenylyltransferase/[glutamine synthetase]-adenylyl-L-tyrosine phosphorylase [Alloscardovia macacae]|uniref:Glutamine-synthetase adenylyltransferase n=1 Tax=Alloscardovia macacae TaxID=1160091 RepID=A0A261F649_9BIFI|nr:bifunctional [glutamine synthetase] adenylyltransferase/[glutamine synthetase]-adenylyl-L-tyrosine phosphorylase [Alloscardovia macacae]OZG54503.1 glutamine-synthetase adenylyltransferase [Alloscardovia macacae]